MWVMISPQERVNCSPSPGKSGDGNLQCSLATRESGQSLSPLPGGEGQGAGGRANTAKGDQGLLTSAATESR
jgi:hypothetical protein